MSIPQGVGTHSPGATYLRGGYAMARRRLKAGTLGVAFVVMLAVAADTASAEEPGVAAVNSAKAALATLAAVAATPTSSTRALGPPFLELARVGTPPLPA